MIFVTVGTHGQPFTRLLDALALLPLDELVVQHGPAPAPSGVRRAVPFMPYGEVLEHLEAARAVVTHAGVGSILSCLRVGHRPIVVPRLRRHGEHVDDHQLDLLDRLAGLDRVVAVFDLAELPQAVAAAPPRRDPEAQGERPLHGALRAALRGATNGALSG
ncbi:MAG: glycosyltransferase [Actinomycetota bacterium]|nr:glycosyltransferase [Actinomycetota bacterium]